MSERGDRSEEYKRQRLNKRKQNNAHLKEKNVITDHDKIVELGDVLENGTFFTLPKLAQVLGVTSRAVAKWVEEGVFPKSQFTTLVQFRGKDLEVQYYRFEEVYVLAHICKDFFSKYHRFNRSVKEVRDYISLIHHNFDLIYKEREMKGLENFEP